MVLIAGQLQKDVLERGSLGDELLGRLFGDDSAAAHDRDAPAELFRLLQVVCGQENREALGVERPQPLPKLEPQLDVDAGGRLVENQELRLVNERARERQPPLLSPRDLRVFAVRVRRQSKPVEQHVGALGDGLSVQTIVARGKDEHVAQREIAIEIELLRRESDEPARLAPLALVVVAEDANAAAARAGQTDDRVDRGRLTGAVRSQKAEELAGADAQRDAVDRYDAAIALNEALDLDRGRDYGVRRASV